MTKEQCLQLLTLMMTLYPNHFKAPEKAAQVMLGPWHAVLGDFDIREASEGLYWYARNERSGFPPSTGQIVEGIVQTRSVKRGDFLSEPEAWALVERAMRDSIYHAEEQFGSLPPIVRRAIGSPAVLTQMALVDKDGVNRGQFREAYESAVRQAGTEASMPKALREIAQSTLDRLHNNCNETPQLPMRAAVGCWCGEVEVTHQEDGWEADGDGCEGHEKPGPGESYTVLCAKRLSMHRAGRAPLL